MTERKRKATKAAVSAHPAFPAIVALWFAALLGLGSWVLPIALFENLSEATGLSSSVIAAQPPLGVTARIVIALIASGLGAVIGIAVARQVVAASRPSAPRREVAPQPEVENPKQPIWAHDELGEGGFDEDLDEPGRSFAADPIDGAAIDNAGSANPPTPEPFDLADFEAPSEGRISDWIAEDRKRETGELDPVSVELTPPEADFPGATHSDPVPARDADTATAYAVSDEARPLGALALAELVERFARALQQHRADTGVDRERASAEDVAVLDLTSALADKAARRPNAPVLAEVIEPDEDDPVEDFTDTALQGYSSLLAMRAAPTVPRETEHALRDALEKLQKLSNVG